MYKCLLRLPTGLGGGAARVIVSEEGGDFSEATPTIPLRFPGRFRDTSPAASEMLENADSNKKRKALAAPSGAEHVLQVASDSTAKRRQSPPAEARAEVGTNLSGPSCHCIAPEMQYNLSAETVLMIS